MPIKSVKGVSWVYQLCSVQSVTNVPLVVPNPPVGSRLHGFWEKWAAVGVCPKVISVLREGYTLPFRSRPYLTRKPTITSCYVDPHRNSYLLEALHQLLNKNAVELVQNPQSLGFYNRLFLVPKPNNRWRPILDLSKLNNYLKTQSFKMETPETIRTSLQAGEWVTSTDFKDAYFHIPINSQFRKYMRFHIQDKTYQFKALPFGLSTAPMEFTVIAKEVKWLAIRRGIRTHQYLDDWLVRATSHQACLQHTQTLVTLCREIGLVSERGKIRAGTQTSFQFRRLPVRLERGQGQTHHRTLADPTNQDTGDLSQSGVSGPESNVPERTTDCHRNKYTWADYIGVPYSGISKTTGECQKHCPHSKDTPPTSRMVAGGKQCYHRSTLTSSGTCAADLNRRIKRRVGRSFKQAHGKGKMVTPGKQTAHKLPRVNGSSSGVKRVSSSLYKQGSSHTYRQHYGGSLHKQRRGNEVGAPLCLTLENTDLVHQKSGNSQGPTYSRPSERDSRQAIQTGPNHSNRMVPQPRDFPSNMQPVAQTSSGPVCHQVQQQASTVCLPCSRLPGLGSGCSQPVVGGTGPLCLLTSSHLGQSGGEVTGLPLQQDHSDCSRVAQHALVLGSSSNVQPDSTVPAQHTKLSVSTIQPGSTQEPVKSEPTCLAPRASAIKEQGFSEAVAARIEAPQRGSTRSVYDAKWTIFTKWCLSNQVDVRAPPLKAIADFLLYLFQVRKLQPGTIDGYRSAIADKLGNVPINVSRDENLTRLLDRFHRDRPKGRRGIPSWNLSLVLHQLTKAPFEPIKEASLKHLTFKTVFLLALGSGKHRSEIHAWLHRNIRHQADWSKVSLYPSPSFLSNNQLAKEGPDSVAPVVIPALAPTLDKSLTGDRSLCPVRALCYYLDRTSDLRQSKELVFVSFKKGFDKDISPATVSSWIKQTVN